MRESKGTINCMLPQTLDICQKGMHSHEKLHRKVQTQQMARQRMNSFAIRVMMQQGLGGRHRPANKEKQYEEVWDKEDKAQERKQEQANCKCSQTLTR